MWRPFSMSLAPVIRLRDGDYFPGDTHPGKFFWERRNLAGASIDVGGVRATSAQ